MTLHFVLASDDNYVRHLAATVLSVVQTTRDGVTPSFHILDAGITEANRERLMRMAAEFGIELAFITSDTPPAADVPLKRYGRAALLRISLAELLPPAISRAIYLDCDTLALADLSPLGEWDLGGHPIAAVENLGHQPVDRLDIPRGSYFNSGMLVLDLERWRRDGLGQQVLDYMTAHRDRLVFPDQDGLNGVLHNNWRRLPLRWNQQPATYSTYRKLPEGEQRREFRDAIQQPALVHFLGRNKPWDYMTFHPLKAFYWHYLRLTPWRDSPYDHKTPLNVLKKALMLEKQWQSWQRRRAGPAMVG